MAPRVLYLQCILPSMQWLIQDSTRAERFCSKKYSANLAATGIVQADSVFSSTLACPVSVNSLGFQPSLHSLSAICCLDDGLNSITLSFKRLPVFSEYRCSIIGGNSSSHCLSILYSLPCMLRCNFLASSKSIAKPLLLTRSATIRIRCSSDIDFSENCDIAFSKK